MCPLRAAVLCLLLAPAVGCSSAERASVCPPAAVATSPEPATTAAATTIVFVRHAEKASDGTPDPGLRPEGDARAACLARVVQDLHVTHAFATDLVRTSSTIRAAAAQHNVQLVTTKASDTGALVETLDALPPGSVALVAGHSNTLPTLVAKLGGAVSHLDARGNIPDAEYDRLVQLVRVGDTTTTVELRYCAPSGSLAK